MFCLERERSFGLHRLKDLNIVTAAALNEEYYLRGLRENLGS